MSPCDCRKSEAERRERVTNGCSLTCHCHQLAHADCPNSERCLGDCGRKTTAGETNAPGYCVACAADPRWHTLDCDQLGGVQ